jgi:acyl-coenzyme A thioesterase PaaI-like protein
MIGAAGEPGSDRTPDGASSQLTLEALRDAEHAGCCLCAKESPLGLKLQFQVQPDGSVTGTVRSCASLRSYPDTVHGGILTAMLDAVMTHALFSIGVVAVTAELKVRFLAPVAPDRDLVPRAVIERDDHPLFHVRAELEQERELRTRASGRFLARGDSWENHG